MNDRRKLWGLETTRARVSIGLLPCAALLALLVLSCSGDSSSPAAADPGPERSWAIHIFAGEERQRVDLGPIPELSGGSEPEGAPAGGLGEVKTQTIFDTPDGTVDIDAAGINSPTFIDAGNGAFTPTWALLWGAAIECGMGNNPPGTTNVSGVSTSMPSMPPWAPSKWFIFDPAALTTCEDLLAAEEVLVCTADKLSQIADGIGSTTWNLKWATGQTIPTGTPPRPWVIPPQADQDRFIARDLAIYTLAHLPMLDGTRVTNASAALLSLPGDDWATCSSLFGKGIADATWSTQANTLKALFRNPDASSKTWAAYPPPVKQVTSANVQTIIEARLVFEAQILRSGTQMLQELVQDSVYSDMAGAARAAGQAVDPKRGRDLAWGAMGPYNSLAHAVRVVAGRWELGPNRKDPKCANIAPLDTLQKAYGADLGARMDDDEIHTKGQAEATQMMVSAGIVLNPSTVGDVKSIVADQVIGIEAARHNAVTGGVINPSFLSGTFATTLKNSINSMSEADVRFGLGNAYRSYQLNANVGNSSMPVGTSPTALRPGLLPSSYISPSLSSVGTAVLNGVGRVRSPSDVSGRMGGILEASQCGDVYAGLNEWEASFGTPTAPSGIDATFQNSFAVAQSLKRRIVRVLHNARLGPGSLGDSAESIALSANAEVRTWAGPGWVHMEPYGTGGVTGVPIEFHDVLPEDFGVNTPAELKDGFSLVWGPPWVAECAAHLRDDCPDNFTNDYVLKSVPASSTATAVSDPDRRLYGRTGYSLKIVFPRFSTASPPKFKPLNSAQGSDPAAPNAHLYLIASSNERRIGGRGTIVGPIALRAGANIDSDKTSFAYSKKQYELLRIILGLENGNLEHVGLEGDEGASQSDSYCVPGVERDVFVPLENELTSDSDQYENSWRHYIAMAKEAAAKADELGQKVIDLGMQQDTRRENAARRIAEICGDAAGFDKIASPDLNGGIKPGTDDANMRECMGSSKRDIVFLSSDPYRGDTGSDLTADKNDLKVRLGCDASQHDVCKKFTNGGGLYPTDTTPSNDPYAVTTGGLGLFSDDGATEVASDCSNVLNVARTLHSGLDVGSLMIAMREPWGTPEGLSLGSKMLEMHVAENGQWYVTAAGSIIMWSDPNTTDPNLKTIWPACLRTPSTCYFDGDAGQKIPPNIRNDLFNELFRSATSDCTNRRCALGTPEKVGSAANEQAELNILRWRVSGALWLLGSISGKVPGGMFWTPVPAVNFAQSGSNPVIAPTIYNAGKFAEVPGQPNVFALSTVDNNADEAQVLGNVKAVDSAFTAYRDNAGATELPSWYRAVYSNPGWYYHTASLPNLEEASDYWGFSHTVLEPHFNYTLRDTTKMLFLDGEALHKVVDQFVGISCQNLYENNPGNGKFDLAGFVAALKANWQANDRANEHSYGGQMWIPTVTLSHNFSTGRDDWLVGFLGNTGWIGNQWHDTLQNQDPRNYTPWFDRPALYVSGNSVLPYGVNKDLPPAFFLRQTPLLYPLEYEQASTENVGAYSGGWTSAGAVSPMARVRAFVNSGPPGSSCAAASQLVGAAGLSCFGANGGGDAVMVLDPPALSGSEQDLVRYELWLQNVSRTIRSSAKTLYMEKLPDSVVKAVGEGKPLQGDAKGERGEKLREIERRLYDVNNGFISIVGHLDELRGKLTATRLRIAGIKLANEQKKIDIQIEAVKALASGINMMAKGLTPDQANDAGDATGKARANQLSASKIVGFGAEAAGLGFEAYESWNPSTDLGDLANQEAATEIATAVHDLVADGGKLLSLLKLDVMNLRQAVSQTSAAAEELRLLEVSASYELAKGTGQDYLVAEDGSIATIPVNTVLRRQFDGTRKRYEKALRDAKALAYLARRAIEQRIGARMSRMYERIGPLDPPSTWADDLCHLTGINYLALREASPDAGAKGSAADDAIITDFADSFIGDYVAKLESFVDYYNVAYPSHEGDDTAVLSLRENLLDSSKACVTQARNLLYQSSRLNERVSGDIPADKVFGWQMSPCRSDKCLEVRDGRALGNVAPPDGAGSGGVTWLVDTVPTGADAGADASADGGGPDGGRGTIDGPGGYVSQPVYLERGVYVLSWWDQARGVDGSATTVSAAPYLASVVDSAWGGIAGFSDKAQGPVGGVATWSPRRSIEFNVTQEGIYRVAFAASDRASGRGSVAISSVQLERTSAGAGASDYQATDSTRDVVDTDCGMRSPYEMRSAFRRMCDKQGFCFYELASPFAIDTKTLDTLGSRLSGKFARGNFNYRHMTVAVNLVGSGVRDCGQSGNPDCYGSGYIEYTLEHDAREVPITDWSGTTDRFDFGLGRIEHGKALAAERYISMPTSSADDGLLSQPGILKPELRGRPIDGSYRLKIWDSPAFRWDRVEDIQLVWKYRYWSRVGN